MTAGPGIARGLRSDGQQVPLRRPGRKVAEPGLHLGRVAVLQLGEDGQRLLQAASGVVVGACGLVREREMGQDLGLVVPVADLAERPQRLPVTGDRVIGTAQAVVRVAEAVQDVGLPAPVAELTEPGQGFLADLEGALEVAEMDAVHADIVQCARLPRAVPGRAVQVERALRGPERLLVAALSPESLARPDAGPRFARAVAELSEQPRGLVELGAPVLITPLQRTGPAHAAQRVRLPRLVPRLACGAEGDPLDLSQLVPAPAPGQEGLQSPRQLPRVLGEPGFRSE